MALIITDSEWACDSNEVIKIRFVDHNNNDEEEGEKNEYQKSVREFSPEFSHQIFSNQQIFGYTNLKVKLRFASSSMTTYFGVTYDEKILDSTTNLVDDVEKTLSELLPDDYITNYDIFLQRVQTDAETFIPMGEKISEYRIDNDNSDKVYEIYKATFKTPRFKEFHKRLRIFVLFYIEAGSYIDEDEDHWEVMLVFEKKNIGGTYTYNLVGFCTMYLFYYLPRTKKNRENNENNYENNGNHHMNEDLNENFSNCEKNKRHLLQITNNQDVSILNNISQFIILPHYQQEGHGGKLYQTIYQYCLLDPRIRQLVDPSELFSEIRDKCDMRYLREMKALEGLVAPVDKKRQMHRCIEIELLQNLNKRDPVAYKAYRLQVKQRVYNWNKELLDQISREERLQKLDETFKGIEEEYQQLILKL
ncbi:7130_t:CDS:10 [Diversispora eburnea]|uniref:Histone acetyltransferase type B catalytic subunit n=1 Tax=Diversispora eburnea TaxID=1213867 RepID=A0A9N9BS38_9GLOM|nr:7130_t:CDS:10 [Diversispora eburnea]